MKLKALLFFLIVIVAMVTITAVLADDGALVRKSMSHEALPTVRGYTDEAEHAFIQMMSFYVPIQAADGTVEPIEYLNIDDSVVDTRDLAKPLIGAYLYGPVESVEGVGFVGHGRRDAYGAISLDDGMTWKHTNLSESSDLSSSQVKRTDIKLFKSTKFYYPGDAVNIFHTVAENKVLVAWPSRYCEGGQPNYSLDPTEAGTRGEAVAGLMNIELTDPSPDDLYLIDMYGVAGHQGSVDYAEDKFEQNHVVGEVPYNCLWTARGVVVQGDDQRTTDVTESSYIRWFTAERLTSGVRDVNRVETKCVAGAGCAITWQEDPDGLRPGQGEGPGEGWSGAIGNHQTDVWYSYIPWEYFEEVQDPSDATLHMPLIDFLVAGNTEKPKPFVPFAMPMRLTDNAKCNVDAANPTHYCIGAATENPENLPLPTQYGLKDMCVDTVEIATGPDNELTDVCISEDGLPLVGNIASTRPRLGLFGYDSDPDDAVAVDSAFVVVVSEESKGLGEFGFADPLATDPTASCDPEEDPENCIAFDEGKNIWYYSFSMSLSDHFANQDPEVTDGFYKDSLPANLGNHGNILNQPEVNWEITGDFYPVRDTELMWNFGEYNYELYNTEIARRGSLLAQGIGKAQASQSGLLALPAWKQGIMKQGGPADVMVRRIIVPDNDPDTEVIDWEIADGNPYAFRNMACENWTLEDGSNPMYPDGICLDPAINLSATIPDTCEDSTTGSEAPCPVLDLTMGEFGISDTNPILQGLEPTEGNTTKTLTWHQCPAEFSHVSGVDQVTCAEDTRSDGSTLADQSWYNPYDVAKGHRGYLDGDFVMILYAWSPNWRLNTVGHDRYELYIRRSFTGGEDWTTLPSSFMASDALSYTGDGTVSCETFRRAGNEVDQDEPRVCNNYAAGANEQARNVTQFSSMRTTVLDPRYTPTAGTIDFTETPELDPLGFGTPVYEGEDEDLRNPSRYFIVYETGDNSTTAEGEPEPLDLFYSRAVNFGDDYQVWAEEDDLTVCYPNDPHGDDDERIADLIGSGFCNEFDQLEQGTPGLEGSESSLAANPGGEFLYAAWSQIQHDTHESDAMARRVWWIYDYVSADPEKAWTITGGGAGGGGGGEDPQAELDIAGFNVSDSVRVRQRVSINLTVENKGNASGHATATVVGTQAGKEVYNESMDVQVEPGDSVKLTFPSYRTRTTGDIFWEAAIAVDGAIIDTEVAVTTVYK